MLFRSDEGDEAFLLSQKLPFAKVIVGKKRVLSAQLAETLDVDYILLDDGMQHRYLHRDIEIVVLHKKGGFLRESLKSLARADYVVVNGVKTEEEVAFLQKYTQAPIMGVSCDFERVWESGWSRPHAHKGAAAQRVSN